MMEYREVYFRIRSAYQYDSGWPDKGAERAFRDIYFLFYKPSAIF